MTLIGQAKLASRVREEVRDRIRDGRFSDGVQLPPEVELATSLGVSRTTVREALLQLEQRGWIKSKWGVSENGRRARYYTITRAGRKQLAAEAESWRRTSEIMTRFLEPSEGAL